MKKYLSILLIAFCLLVACSKQQQKTTTTISNPNGISTESGYIINTLGDTIPTGVPISIKGKEISRDRVATPITKPVGQPAIFAAYKNTFEALPSKRVKIPDNLPVVIPGKNGEPLPDTKIVHIKGKVMPAIHPERVAAKPMQMTNKTRYDIRYLDIKGGVQSTALGAMIMDSQGYLWFGNINGGFSQFDGKYFKHFSKQEGLSNNQTISIYEDKKRNFWIGTMTGGVCLYDGNQITQFTQKEGFPLSFVINIIEDNSGFFWFWGSEGLLKFTPNREIQQGELRGTFHQFKHLFSNTSQGLLVNRHGHIWIAHEGGKLRQYVPSKNGDIGYFIPFTKKEGLSTNLVGPIIEDRKGNIWLGTAGEGLIRYEPNQNGIGGYFTHFPIAKSLQKDAVRYLMEATDGSIWFVTYGNGIFRFELPKKDNDNGRYTQFTIEEGLTVNQVESIVEDTHKNIWIATSHGGVCRLDLNSFTNFGAEAGLSETPVHSIIEDKKKNMWFGTGMFGLAGKGLFRFDSTTFLKYTTKNGLATNFIRSIIEDSRGDLWLSSRNGLGRFNQKNITNYQVLHESGNTKSWYTLEDRLGNIWVATGGDGLSFFKPNPDTISKEGVFTHFTEKEGLSSNFLYYLFEDKCHHIWFTGNSGLGYYIPTKDGMENVVYLRVDKNDQDFYVWTGMQDHKGRIWFGTHGNGLSIYKPNGCDSIGIFSQITTEDGLLDNRIWSIIEDKEKRVWIGTDKGLCLFVPIQKGESIGNPSLLKEYKLYTFNDLDGLPQISFMRSSVSLDSKNRLWWGRNKGISMLDLNTFQLPTEPPKNVQLSHIDIQQKNIDYRQLSDSLYRDKLAFGEALHQTTDSVITFNNYPVNLKLPYDLNYLTFHFSALDWAAPHKIQYSSYLEGLEEKWNAPVEESKVDYRNLPHGDFTLKVKAIGEAQVWSDTFEYSFKILPPWWHTWWAYCLYAIAVLGSVGWYVQRLRKKLEKEETLNLQLTTSNQQLENLNIANSRFVPNDFLQILGKESLLDLQLGDQTAAKMTILFADIRDYTTMSETMTPEQNFKFINAFLGRMGPIIKANGGFICQYFGDGIMALFKKNHHLAIKAAIEMQQKIGFYNAKRIQQERQIFKVGIGLNTGQLMLGVIGDKERYDSSVISDAVNTAARMEGLTKIFGCMLIISESTLQELLVSDTSKVSDTLDISSTNVSDTLKVSDTVAYRFLGKVKVKGKHIALKIYDLYEGDSKVIKDLKNQTKTNFEKAIYLYFEKEFGKAADLLKMVLEIHPDDKAAKYYFEKALQYVVNGVEETWSGVEEMVSK